MTTISNKDELRKLIGINIRNERVARDMTLDELAELLELSVGSMGLIERGLRGATNYSLTKLSEVFQQPIDYFFRVDKPKSGKIKLKETNETDVKRAKISSLLNDLSITELEFIIQTVKSLKAMNKRPSWSSFGDEDDD
jgi:transcriptional regulator with XRE-family HTH domain